MNLEHKTRLVLLSHSKNMLMAAQASDWERYEQLNTAWSHLLDEAQQNVPEAIQACQPQLLEDNSDIVKLVEKHQKTLFSGLQKELKGLKSVRAYLE